MNGTNLNSSPMYEEVAEVSQLNRVEGFDPKKYMRIIQKEGQPGRYYLDVAYRKLWFRLRYPEGKIVKKLVRLTDQVAIVEARVYLHRNDEEEGFVSNALAQKYQTNDGEFGNKYVELAETAAVGRALSDAGFGLQFADMEGDFDPEVTESPIDGQVMSGVPIIQEDTHTEGVFYDEGVETDMEGYTTTEAVHVAKAAVQDRRHMNSVPQNGAKTADKIRNDMPVAEIYSMLDRDTAAAVVVTMGFNKGKTLGQVAVEKPNSLKWYVTSYGGPDNLLRAAAQFLMDAALQQAG
jgi:hypothetical protein